MVEKEEKTKKEPFNISVGFSSTQGITALNPKSKMKQAIVFVIDLEKKLGLSKSGKSTLISTTRGGADVKKLAPDFKEITNLEGTIYASVTLYEVKDPKVLPHVAVPKNLDFVMKKKSEVKMEGKGSVLFIMVDPSINLGDSTSKKSFLISTSGGTIQFDKAKPELRLNVNVFRSKKGMVAKKTTSAKKKSSAKKSSAPKEAPKEAPKKTEKELIAEYEKKTKKKALSKDKPTKDYIKWKETLKDEESE